MICSFVGPSIPSNNIIAKLRKLRSVFPSVCSCAFQRRRNVEDTITLSRWNLHLQVLCQSRSRSFIADMMMESLTSSIVSFSPPGTRDSSNAVLPCVISCRSTLSRRLKASKLILSVMFRFWTWIGSYRSLGRASYTSSTTGSPLFQCWTLQRRCRACSHCF
jgi:hypothetical protein